MQHRWSSAGVRKRDQCNVCLWHAIIFNTQCINRKRVAQHLLDDPVYYIQKNVWTYKSNSSTRSVLILLLLIMRPLIRIIRLIKTPLIIT